MADEFEVSRRTVERHGRQERWKQQAQELDRDSARQAAGRIRDTRAEKLVDTEKLVDATYLRYANQLVAGQVKVTPSHLATLFQLREQIWDRVDVEMAVQPEPPPGPSDPTESIERKLQVLRALEEAGVLGRLLRSDTPETA